LAFPIGLERPFDAAQGKPEGTARDVRGTIENGILYYAPTRPADVAAIPDRRAG
jgi:hypothetical protein